MLELIYNQSMIARLCGSSPPTVLRTVAAQQIEAIELSLTLEADEFNTG